MEKLKLFLPNPYRTWVWENGGSYWALFSLYINFAYVYTYFYLEGVLRVSESVLEGCFFILT